MSIYIIFLDSILKGYLSDQDTVLQAVSNLADKLIQDIKNQPDGDKIRILRENRTDGIDIYTQSLGTYVNGSPVLVHQIRWQAVPLYS
jgi:hypothetical protein